MRIANLLRAAAAALLICCVGAPAPAQIGGLGRALGRITQSAPVPNVLGGKEPISTSLPDAKWGETPCAFVHLKPAAGDVKPADIIAWCREQLAHFKVPRTVVFGELPKTSTGKIQKFVLREHARAMPGGSA